jgi:hypothetical protein
MALVADIVSFQAKDVCRLGLTAIIAFGVKRHIRRVDELRAANQAA